MKPWGIISLSLIVLLAACNPAEHPAAPEVVTASSVPYETVVSGSTPTPSPTSTSEPTALHTSSPALTPLPTPTIAVVSGYWIQNTTREGLCTDSPRFIEFGAWQGNFIAGSGATVCSTRAIVPRVECGCGGDCPRKLLSWHTINVPNVTHISSGAYVPLESDREQWNCYSLPGFAGSNGLCVLNIEERWQCFTLADGLPFDDIRAYGIVQETGVEWFMSRDSIASRGLQHDQFYSIPTLLDDPGVRLTWLAVPRSANESVWIGTNGRGLLRIRPETQQITRYTTADGLPDDEIRDVQACGFNCVWVATPQGIGRWNGYWTTYTTHDGLPSDDVYGISFSPGENSNSDVWAATAAGPAFFAHRRNRWQAIPDWPVGVEVTGVMGKWFSTRGHGLMRFINAPVIHGISEIFTTDDGLPDNHITSLAVTDGGVLVGTPRGAVEWDGVAWWPVTAEPVNDVSSTMIGTEYGLWVWNGDEWKRVSDERVTHVTANGWYATGSQVCQWLARESHCPPTDDGQALAEAQDLYSAPGWDTVTVVGDDTRLWQYDAQACEGGCFVPGDYGGYMDTCDPILPARINEFLSLDDRWLMATDEGVYDNWAGGNWGLAGGWPLAVRDVKLGEQTIWIATNQGAFYVHQARYTGEIWSYISGLPDRDLSAILPLPDGSVWIGTMTTGLIHFEPEQR